jgi:hypothetical protein
MITMFLYPDYPVSLRLDLISSYPNFRTPYQYEIFKNGILATDRVGYGGILVCVSPNSDDMVIRFIMLTIWLVRTKLTEM